MLLKYDFKKVNSTMYKGTEKNVTNFNMFNNIKEIRERRDIFYYFL